MDALLETVFIQYSFEKYEKCLETLERVNPSKTLPEHAISSTRLSQRCIELAYELLLRTGNTESPERWSALANFSLAGFYKHGLHDVMIGKCKELLGLLSLTQEQRGLLCMFIGIGQCINHQYQ